MSRIISSTPLASTNPAPLDHPAATPLIEARSLHKSYATPAGSFTALRGVSLRVEPGELIAVIGRSGSGKSTLLNLLTGIDRPSSGEIHVAGAALHAMKESQLPRWRGRTVGIVFQFFQLLPALTVAENVMLPMDLCQTVPSRERRGRAVALLERVGIAEQADKLPTTLSGGQQQRAAIARALANDPPLLVADEPTGNLDSHTAGEVLGLFAELADGGKTVVLVTHERDCEEIATRVVSLADGRIVGDESGRRVTSAERPLEQSR